MHLCRELKAAPLAPLQDCTRDGALFVRRWGLGVVVLCGGGWGEEVLQGLNPQPDAGRIALQTKLDLVKQALFGKYLMSIIQ